MIEILFSYILALNPFYIPAILTMLCFCVFLWIPTSRVLGIKPYKAKQRIHDLEIPRFGGLIIFSLLYIFIIYGHINESDHDHVVCLLSLCSIPIFCVGLYEDISQNTHPYLRLFSMFIAATMALIVTNIALPSLSFPFFGPIISDSFLIYPFLIISIVIFINGMNMIDGSNGLLSLTAICQLASIIFISIQSGDLNNIDITVMLIVALICFLPLNYPFGKIFLGDLGAYMYGFFIAFITIRFYGDNPTIPSWGAVLILFYPLIEVFFSYFRKIFLDKLSPFSADLDHIHLKIFYVFNYKISKKISNNLVMPTLSILWLSPVILYTWSYDSVLGLVLALLILVLIYFGLYWAIPRYK